MNDPRTTFATEPAVDLAGATATVLGCGSVGGLAAWCLSAGVGSLKLADRDRLMGDNPRRQVLDLSVLEVAAEDCNRAAQRGFAQGLHQFAEFLAVANPVIEVIDQGIEATVGGSILGMPLPQAVTVSFGKKTSQRQVDIVQSETSDHHGCHAR